MRGPVSYKEMDMDDLYDENGEPIITSTSNGNVTNNNMGTDIGIMNLTSYHGIHNNTSSSTIMPSSYNSTEPLAPGELAELPVNMRNNAPRRQSSSTTNSELRHDNQLRALLSKGIKLYDTYRPEVNQPALLNRIRDTMHATGSDTSDNATFSPSTLSLCKTGAYIMWNEWTYVTSISLLYVIVRGRWIYIVNI